MKRLPAKLLALEYSLIVGCRYNCRFCPQENHLRSYFASPRPRSLTFEDFKLTLEQVVLNGHIIFAGMSEPFSHPDCSKMIRYAYDKGYNLELLSTFELMSDNDWELIKDIDFEKIVIHVADAENNAKFILSPDYPKKIAKVLERFPLSQISCHGTFHPVIKPMLMDRCNMCRKLIDRAGNLDLSQIKSENLGVEFFEPHHHKGKIACVIPKMDGGIRNPAHTMLPDGTVIACCNDYSMTHIFGNLLSQTWEEIAEGTEYNRLKQGLENDEVKNILCRFCHRATTKRKTDPAWLRIPPLYQTLNYNNYTSPHTDVGKLMERFRTAKNICIFGLGKIFKDIYFQGSWNLLINANIFSDNAINNITEYNGVLCIPPGKLIEFDELLVISFVKQYQDIHRQLADMGIQNVMSIFDIVNIMNESAD